MSAMVEQATKWDAGIEYAAVSDVGMRRMTNQDNYAAVLAEDPITYRDRGHIFLIADGMGAHAAGELASKIAADAIPHHYFKYRQLPPAEALQKAIEEANSEIHRRGQANPDFHNMGTTASALAILPDGALVAHVGDSRVYRLQGQQFAQLTFDHSLVWELRAAGQLPRDPDASQAIPKNVITRSLGPNANVQTDLEGPYPLQVGDTFLLCSDGLTGQVTDEEIGPILANLAPRQAAQVLVDLANLRGGPDNITVVIARITRLAEVPDGEDRSAQVLGPRSHPKAHPAVWVTMAVCFVAAIALALLEYRWTGLVLALAGLGALALGLIQTFGLVRGGAGPSRRLGRGPYRTAACQANGRFAEMLAGIVDELKEVAEEDGWLVDWQPFDGYCRQAEKATSKHLVGEAVRQYCLAISFMMQQFRSKRAKRASDTAVE